ncbi:MAG: colicin V production protein [Betaproteobacteria bacterium SG8_41]|jgi:membrane protein required for colicin V production|nr:MAG: colicin V production protein [Betaproteobacteria bacterium SG8_41]
MTVFDYVVIAIVGLSILLSVIRGLVREVLALLAWVIAFLAANFFAGPLATLLPDEMSNVEVRLLVGFGAAFVVVLLSMSLLAMFASKLVKNAGLGVEDRMLGGVFGLARGMLVVMVLVLLAGLTSLPKQPVWREAMLSKPLESFAGRVKPWLPGGLSQRITYD